MLPPTEERDGWRLHSVASAEQDVDHRSAVLARRPPNPVICGRMQELRLNAGGDQDHGSNLPGGSRECKSLKTSPWSRAPVHMPFCAPYMDRGTRLRYAPERSLAGAVGWSVIGRCGSLCCVGLSAAEA